MNFNSVTLVGRLTRDPEMRTTNTGKNLVKFAIAVNKRFKPQDGGPEADFFNCTAWGQKADYVNQYIGKGRLVLVQGRIETRKYQDKDGNNREAIDIVCEEVNAMDSNRRDGEEGGSASGASGGGGYGRASGGSSGGSSGSGSSSGGGSNFGGGSSSGGAASGGSSARSGGAARPAANVGADDDEYDPFADS